MSNFIFSFLFFLGGGEGMGVGVEGMGEGGVKQNAPGENYPDFLKGCF